MTSVAVERANPIEEKNQEAVEDHKILLMAADCTIVQTVYRADREGWSILAKSPDGILMLFEDKADIDHYLESLDR